MAKWKKLCCLHKDQYCFHTCFLLSYIWPYVAKCSLHCRNSMKPLNHAIALRDYHWLLTSKKSLSSDWNMKIAIKNIVIYKTIVFYMSIVQLCNLLWLLGVRCGAFVLLCKCKSLQFWQNMTEQNYWSTLSSTTTAQRSLHFWASVLTEPCVVNCAAEEWGYKTKSWPINSAIAKLTDFGYFPINLFPTLK